MIRISQLQLRPDANEEQMIKKAARLLKIQVSQIKQLKIIKQSLDARKKNDLKYIYTIDVSVENEAAVLNKIKDPHIAPAKEVIYQFPQSGAVVVKHRPIIIGFGPAGIFCGLMLARNGYSPVILERGDDVLTRQEKVDRFWKDGILDTESNVQFGEGGAGAFSDGKLNTLVKDTYGRNRLVLETLIEFGADPAIRYQNKPHVGTDVLCHVVKRMREEIIRLGGEVHFQSKVIDFEIQHGSITGVILQNSERIPASTVVLAIGHSSRDTFQTLFQRKVPMQAKAFAVGLRIQHTQKMIDHSQYGSEDLHELLGAANYKLTYQTTKGRGVYSFCMCPGGYVVNASSEEGGLAVNGMSYHARDGKNANSALIVTVTPDDFENASPLAGVEFQRKLEQAAYAAGNGKIPVQLYSDFKQNQISLSFGQITPEFCGQYTFANIREILPDFINEALIEGIDAMDAKIHGFSNPDALLAGVESRTSSPVRIDRNAEFESEIHGLFPCGEGAGYAGGIMSAAMDGIRVAEEIGRRFVPITVH